MFKFLLPLVLSTAMLSFSANADDWKPLTDEPSRADLFLRVVQSYQEDSGQAMPTESEAKSFAFHNAFLFPHDVEFDVDGSKRKNSLFLIDISHYTDKSIALNRMRAQGVIGVYTKASQSVDYRDPTFAYFWKALGDLSGSSKVYRGAYHFLSSSTDGEAQAKAFIKLINENGGALADDMPPVVDLEWDIKRGSPDDGWSKRSPDQIMSSVLAFLKYVEANGGPMKKPMIYTAKSWWTGRMGGEANFAQLKGYKIWIADYSKSSQATENPRVPNSSGFDIWQFTENAKLSVGYPKALDANVFKGTEDQFKAQFISAQ